VNLLRCNILGFGKLADLSLIFRDGLNLVFAANEGGKSTLQRFLIGLLYGQLRADVRSQRRLESWVEQYRPWTGEAYGGILWCRLQNGREIEIHRSFGKDETRIEIRTATGEMITGEYEQQKNGDVLFARTHLELPKDLFESIAVIRESRLTELNSQDSIRDRITNLALSGEEDLSIRQSLDRLRGALDDIGSERAPTRPYMQALDELASLQAESAATAARRAEFLNLVDERNRLAAECARLECELAAARRAVLTARFRETESKVRGLEDLDLDLICLSGEIEPLRTYTSFPAHDLEELNQLVGACSSMEKSLAEVRIRLEAADAQACHAKEERRQMEAYASIDAEKISDWFVNYLSLMVKRDEAQKSFSQNQQETGALERNLSQLGPALRSAEVDWQRRAREAAEEERVASEKSLRLGGKITGLKAQLSQTGARRSQKFLLGYTAALCALAPFAVRYLPGAEALPILLVLGICGAFGAVAVVMFSAGAKMQPELERIEREIQSLEAEQTRTREEGQKIQHVIRQAVQDSGYGTLEEFLEAAKQAEQYRHRLVDLSARTAEKVQQRERFQSECAEVFANIKEALGRVGLSCSPANINTQVTVMRSNMRRFRELDGSCRNLGEQAESLRAEDVRLTNELTEKTARIQAILSEAGVETAEAFRKCCRKRHRVTELIEKEASRAREFQRLCGDLTLEDWQQRMKDLKEAVCQAADAAGGALPGDAISGAATERSPCLPYQPGVEEAELAEKQVTARLASAREDYARIVERVSQASQSFRPVSEVEEDLALTERKVRELSRNREALRVAIETIQTLSREQQEVLAPQLNGSVEQRFLRLCQGRYEEVRIDPEFHIYAREAHTGELRAVEYLSRGTQDQLYFALRFGILDLVSNKQEACPCLLDEPFAAYDHQRIIEAFRILEEEAKRRQLFVFTCREDLRDIAQIQGAHIIRMANDE